MEHHILLIFCQMQLLPFKSIKYYLFKSCCASAVEMLANFTSGAFLITAISKQNSNLKSHQICENARVN
jgi:hypothetical protein